MQVTMASLLPVGLSGKIQISDEKNLEKPRKSQMNLNAISADH